MYLSIIYTSAIKKPHPSTAIESSNPCVTEYRRLGGQKSG